MEKKNPLFSFDTLDSIEGQSMLQPSKNKQDDKENSRLDEKNKTYISDFVK